MPVGIGAAGFMGLALEASGSPGTYVAPTKFFPFNSETLAWAQDMTDRRPIRQSADVIGVVQGNYHIEGDVVFEATEDVVPYFLYCARTAPVKTGAGPNYTYTFKPAQGALPSRTMSLTVVRDGQVFGYVGLVVSSYTFQITNGELEMSCTMLGRDETTQSMPTPAFSGPAPLSLGMFAVQVGGAGLTDADTFQLQVNDNGTPQYRLGASRGASYINYGERSVQVTMDRDFTDRTEYDAFKTATQYHVNLTATRSVNNSISLDVPVGIKKAYAVNLSGQGELIRVSNAYDGVIDATGNSYTITVLCQENIT